MIAKCFAILLAVFVAGSTAAPCLPLSPFLPSCMSASFSAALPVPLSTCPLGSVPACVTPTIPPVLTPSVSSCLPALHMPACIPPPPVPLPIPACVPAAFPLQACVSTGCLPIC